MYINIKEFSYLEMLFGFTTYGVECLYIWWIISNSHLDISTQKFQGILKYHLVISKTFRPVGNHIHIVISAQKHGVQYLLICWLKSAQCLFLDGTSC